MSSEKPLASSRPRDEELEAVGDRGIGIVGARERRDVHRVRDDEGRMTSFSSVVASKSFELQQAQAVGRSSTIDAERRAALCGGNSDSRAISGA